MIPAAQPEMRFLSELPPGRPLVPMEVALFFLDTDAADVLARMEDGRISHAWDIGLGREKRELRFYWRSLMSARQSQIGNRQSPILDEAVYADVIPTNWQRPRASLLYRRWTCSPQLLADLMTGLHLRAITEAHRGETGSPEILRDSVIDFLKTRRCR